MRAAKVVYSSAAGTSRARAVVACSLALAGIACSGPPDPEPPSDCDYYASSLAGGGGDGSRESPFASVIELVDALAAAGGGAGCLLADAPFDESVVIEAGGNADSPLSLSSAPGGDPAVVRGYLEIGDAADYVVLSGVIVDGSGADDPTVQIFGDHAVIRGCELTNGASGGQCLILGDDVFGEAVDVTIEENLLHECGDDGATDGDHGIYVHTVRGGTIHDNVIAGTAAFGVQFYPDAHDVTLAHNVIWGSTGQSGVILAGEDDARYSRNITVEANIIGGHAQYGVDSVWGGSPGTGNTVVGNCIFGNGEGAFGDMAGYAESGTVTDDPQLGDPGAGDFSLSPGSPCVGVGPR